MISDPALPAASLLLDEQEAAAILEQAAAPACVERLAVTGVRYQPGRRLAARYRANVRWPSGHRTTETAGLLTQVRELPSEAIVIGDDNGVRVAAWLYPHDPLLPGLPSAASPHAVRQLLRDLGAHGGPVTIQPHVYRPTARAVLSVHSPPAALFLKVVRPSQAAALHRRHEEVSESLPVPISYGYAREQGIVVLQACPGEQLGSALVKGRPLPPPASLLILLDRLPAIPVSDTNGASPATTVRAHAQTLLSIVPHEANRIRAIADAAADTCWEPDRIVHGDFYEAQVLIEGGRVTALLDIDRLRPGDGLDDAANLLAHLDVLAWSHPRSAPRIREYRAAVAMAVADRGPAASLARRIAGTMLGLAAWPFRAHHPDWRAKTSRLLDLADDALSRAA